MNNTEGKSFLERKNDNRVFPILDDTQPLSQGRLWLIAILTPLLFFVGIVPQLIDFDKDNMLLALPLQFVQTFAPLILLALMLRYLAKNTLKTFFHKITLKDFFAGIIALTLATIYSSVAENIVTMFSTVADNGGAKAFTENVSPLQMIVVFVITTISDAFSLLSEELLAIILMLVFATLANKYWHVSRGGALWIGTIVSIIVFGFMHFSAYDWHIAQMFIIIGMSRLFYNGVYIRTKNLWVSYLCHFAWDTVIFAIVMIAHFLNS
ncbi:CPBP family intramembrane glutamic endopeptidase [Lentilactobacillus kribbianus]|uniref:CPBP family intramembrane glutamic endopeptidase n=1 Tax=Lentilactobacillus kribbianus TaxID=2729622 RepID=UPI0015540DAA|nr:CPBP family intramembrane glutamic endopeptidase [Lentilactobacillus kribbianus]